MKNVAKTKPLRAERALLKTKYYFKKNYIGLIALLIILAGVVFLVLALLPENPNEITESDVFALKAFNAKQISVFGVKLGDSTGIALKNIGETDKLIPSEANIENWWYSKRIGLDEFGLILHFESGILTRITFQESFNKYLSGKTKIDKTKEQIYSEFGDTDSDRHVQVSSATGKAYRIMTYNSLNLEFILSINQQKGFSFFL